MKKPTKDIVDATKHPQSLLMLCLIQLIEKTIKMYIADATEHPQSLLMLFFLIQLIEKAIQTSIDATKHPQSLMICLMQEMGKSIQKTLLMPTIAFDALLDSID